MWAQGGESDERYNLVKLLLLCKKQNQIWVRWLKPNQTTKIWGKKKKAPLKLKVVWKWPAGIALLHTHTHRDLNIEINGHITKNKGA